MSQIPNIPSQIPLGDLYSFINDFPALLWRIEILKARIEFLNRNHDVAPGVDGSLLLKNAAYRNARLIAEDGQLVETFLDMVKEGKTAATVFRVKNEAGGISWLKLTGAVNRHDPAWYYGFLLNADDTVSVIKGVLDTDLELKQMIEDAQNPMMLFDYHRRDLICANSSAKQLLAMGEADFRALTLNELCAPGALKTLEDLFPSLPLSRKWTGTLRLVSRDKSRKVNGDAIVRYLVHKGRGVIGLSLHNTSTRPAANSGRQLGRADDTAQLSEKLSNLVDINEILATSLESSRVSDRFEGILFSDVQVRKNRVTVYGAGSPFADMEQSETFSYKGTIAEDINRYSLEYLVVDDTQDSIKPIDWALFVPRGIRSYFAMPFYSRTVLRTVLILCATDPGRFAGADPQEFSQMLNTVNIAVRAWRRHLRG